MRSSASLRSSAAGEDQQVLLGEEGVGKRRIVEAGPDGDLVVGAGDPARPADRGAGTWR